MSSNNLKSPSPEFKHIRDHSEFETLMDSYTHRRPSSIALDIEADSLHHFKEKVCLIQMSINGQIYLVDPLSGIDIRRMAPLLADPAVEILVHGGDYDIRCLYRDYQLTVENLFDTQIACQFLGYDGTSLDAVLQKHYGVKLTKKYQTKDWSARPLPQEMLIYAAADVAYLQPLTKELKRQLAAKNRLSWVLEENQRLSQVRPAPNNDDPLFVKVRGAGRLDRRSLAVLEALLHLRLKIAAEKDRPPFKIFSNQVLLKLAHAKPATLTELKSNSQGLSKKQMSMYASQISSALKSALALKEKTLPKYPRKRSNGRGLTPIQNRRVNDLKQWRDQTAEVLGIDGSLVCTKQLMVNLVSLNPQSLKELDAVPDIKNWQIEAFGDQLLSCLN